MSEDVLKLLGKRIRELRKELGMTQEQLAEACGFHPQYIGAVERAENNIATANLAKIATALKVGVYDLFIYSKAQNSGVGKSHEINQMIKLLLSLNHNQVKKARVILQELFDKT